MRRAFVFMLLLALPYAAQPDAAADELDRVLALLAQRTHGHVTFTEEDHLAVLDRPVRSAGELFYERPDHLEKRTLTPRLSSLLLQGGTVTIHSGRRQHVLALRDYPQLTPVIESLRATLAGDRRALEQVFQVRFDGNLDRWSLSLVPLDPRLLAVIRQIHIEGARDELRTIEILQADGDRSDMTIGSAALP